MRRVLGAGTVLLASWVGVTPAAHAMCGSAEGTVPGSPPAVYAVGPVYIDDRGLFSWNDESDPEDGIWIYLEDNDQPGLQRGGEQAVHAKAGPLPCPGPIYPIPVDVTGDGNPEVTLFPNGSGTGLCEIGWYEDACRDSWQPDLLLF